MISEELMRQVREKVVVLEQDSDIILYSFNDLMKRTRDLDDKLNSLEEMNQSLCMEVNRLERKVQKLKESGGSK